MKTKIRTLIAICALGIIGLMNINAVSDNKKEVASYKPEISAIESEMTDEALIYSAQSYADIDINNEIASFETAENRAEEITLSDEAMIYSAQAFSSADIENEIEEYEINQILPEENAMVNEVKYSAKTFSDIDFENEIKNRQ